MKPKFSEKNNVVHAEGHQYIYPLYSHYKYITILFIILTIHYSVITMDVDTDYDPVYY